MLPKNLHIEQIERFFSTFKELAKEIETTEDVAKRGELSMQYFYLSELWHEMDRMTEKIKDTIDNLGAEEE